MGNFKKNIAFLCLLPILVTACVVSKKKYEELEYAKRRSDARVRALTEDNSDKDKLITNLDKKLQHTVAEYNEVKNSMSESNAMKTSEIDALMTEVMELTSDTTLLKEKLQLSYNLFNDTKKLNEKNKLRISELETKVEQLQADSSQLAKELRNIRIDANWDKKKKKERKTELERLLEQKQTEIEALKEELKVANGKASWLRKVKTKNEEEIERLSNQIKLYKKELEKAQKSLENSE